MFVSAIAEAADPDPWRTAPDGREISVLPVPRLFRNLAALAGYPATRSEDLVDQLCIMLDAIGADGGLRINPEAMVRLRQVGKAILDDIDRFGWGSAQSAAASVVGTLPEVT